jgi:hypothetical protein
MNANRSPRHTPWLDLAALVLIGAGAACYARAYTGLERLRDGHVPPPGQFTALAQFGRESQLGSIGLALVAAGLAVGVVATIVTRRRARAALS